MKLNRVEGHPGMVNNKVISAAAYTLAQEMIAANGGNPLISRKAMKSFHLELRGKKASPFIFAKNLAAKTKNPGIYDLSKLKAETVKNSPSQKITKSGNVITVPRKEKTPKAETAKPKAEKRIKKAPKQIEAPAETVPFIDNGADVPETL